MRNEALEYVDAGLCVIPCNAKDKHPLYSWKKYQQTIITRTQLNALLQNNFDAICIICGKISGNFEVIDFDNKGEYFSKWFERVVEADPKLAEKLVIESTQSGGVHVAYRCVSEVDRNLKLAKKKGKILIETRGEGGLVLVAPSKGYLLKSNRFQDIGTISAEERNLLLNIARSMDEVVRQFEGNIDYAVSQYKPQPVCSYSGSNEDPADDYNTRGNIEELLFYHGWTLFEETNKEKRYSRPGKDTGVSASWNGTIFFVFSTSDSIFEGNKGYNRFQVYCMLNCGGNIDVAKRELLNLGYGIDITKGVDLTGIYESAGVFDLTEENEDEKELKDHGKDGGKFPERLLSVGGFIGRVAEHTYTNAHCPNKVMAFVSAVALMGHLIGRKVESDSGIMPNAYFLGLGNSTTGKDQGRKTNVEILKRIQDDTIFNSIASAEGVEDRLLINPRLFLQTDEIDGMLLSIKEGKDNRFKNIQKILLEMYSTSDSDYTIRAKAGVPERFVVSRPHLTMFGTAVPKYFYGAFSEKMLADGFFSRMIIIEGYKREKDKDIVKKEVPERIIEEAKHWKDLFEGGNLGGMFHDKRLIVKKTEEATALINIFRDEVSNIIQKYEEKDNEMAMSVWGRAMENMGKLSLIKACSDDYLYPLIDEKCASWAIEVIKYCVSNMMLGIDKITGEDPIIINCDKIEKILMNTKSKYLSRVILKKRSKLSSKVFDEAIKEMIADDKIEEIRTSVQDSPRKSTIYRIKK